MRPARLARPARNAGFTLLEMIVVLVIIGLIMGLIGPRLFGQADRAKLQTAETQVKMLRGALETMRLDIGRYPSAQEGLGILALAPSDPKLATRWRGPYIDGPVPNDPWSNAYRYDTAPSAFGAFSLYSLGTDGEPGGEGDAADVGLMPIR